MPAKRFNYQQFTIPLKSGSRLLVECSSAHGRDHVSQKAETRRHFYGPEGEYTGRMHFIAYAQYQNRPWESFDYENAIRALARRFEENNLKEDAADIRAWIDAHAAGEREEAEKFLADFKNEWDQASPGLKSAIQAGGMIQTEEQAKSTLAILKMGNLLNSMK